MRAENRHPGAAQNGGDARLAAITLREDDTPGWTGAVGRQ
jgi:hypothetical protein